MMLCGVQYWHRNYAAMPAMQFLLCCDAIPGTAIPAMLLCGSRYWHSSTTGIVAVQLCRYATMQFLESGTDPVVRWDQEVAKAQITESLDLIEPGWYAPMRIENMLLRVMKCCMLLCVLREGRCWYVPMRSDIL
eukprot:905236-Rhodomonas_salina.4